MPTLSTSLCMVSGPGALPLLRKLTNLNECLGVNIFHKLVFIAHIKPAVIWVFRRIKIPMIVLHQFVGVIEVIRIKMFALCAEVPFDRFGKELCLVSICLGDFVVVAQCWIIMPTLWLEEVHDFAASLAWVGL